MVSVFFFFWLASGAWGRWEQIESQKRGKCVCAFAFVLAMVCGSVLPPLPFFFYSFACVIMMMMMSVSAAYVVRKRRGNRIDMSFTLLSGLQ